MPRRHRPGASAGSVLSHIEEIIVATSGEDAFELVLALAAARLLGKRGSLRARIGEARRAHPELGLVLPRATADALLLRVDALLAQAMPPGDDRFSALDAVFESLVPRVSKSDKGQFFTPRHVVDFVVSALAPGPRDVLVDPACGSGAFLAHAGRARSFGCDVDARAVRVARLLAIAQGRDPRTILRADGLRTVDLPRATVIATNPPFAGRAPADGFEVARIVRTPERDVLFLERAIDLLAPGGRLGIVLPYNKAAGTAFAGLRRWLGRSLRIFAVVGLPRETFMPHTSQRTFVLFGKKRAVRREALDARGVSAGRAHPERAMFVVSERAGKDVAGAPSGTHDLGEVLAVLAPFLAEEGFRS